MPITLTQAAKRNDTIGSSDAAVILMGDRYPWRSTYNAMSLWREKLGKQKPVKETKAMAAGNAMELTLFHEAQKLVGPLTKRHVQRFHPNNTTHATIDALAIDPVAVVELKAVGEGNRFWDTKRWGRHGSVVNNVSDTSQCTGFDEASDQAIFSPGMIPEEYYWQIVTQMVVFNADEIERAPQRGRDPKRMDHGYLVAHTPGGTDIFRKIRVNLNAMDADWAESTLFNWHSQHIFGEVPPPEMMTPSAMQIAILSDEGEGVVTDAQFLQLELLRNQRREIDRQSREVDKQVKLLEAEIWTMGGDHTTLRSESGHVIRKIRCNRAATGPSEYFRTDLVRKEEDENGTTTT
jgi:hypothetical protein